MDRCAPHRHRDRLARQFPDYAGLASPKAISARGVQAQLDEALVLAFDTDDRFKPTPVETFLWIITKTDVRWMRSELGTAALQHEVAALRSGSMRLPGAIRARNAAGGS